MALTDKPVRETPRYRPSATTVEPAPIAAEKSSRSKSEANRGVLVCSGTVGIGQPDPLPKDFDEQYPGVRGGDADRQQEAEWYPVQPSAALKQQGDGGQGIGAHERQGEEKPQVERDRLDVRLPEGRHCSHWRDG